MSAMSELAATADQIAGLGHNQPPPDPFGAIKAHIEDLLTEARNWADGTEAETQAQVDEINRLIDDLSDAESLADAERVKEKAPLDKQIEEIQERYNPYIAPLKNKVPGKIPLAVKALKAAKEPFLLKREQEALEAAEAARLEAQRIADKAAQALQSAGSDLAASEQAHALMQQADDAAKVAKRATKAASTGTGLRTNWVATLTDTAKAARWVWAERLPQLEAFLQDLADAEVRNGRREIPGFTITKERRA